MKKSITVQSGGTVKLFPPLRPTKFEAPRLKQKSYIFMTLRVFWPRLNHKNTHRRVFIVSVNRQNLMLKLLSRKNRFKYRILNTR